MFTDALFLSETVPEDVLKSPLSNLATPFTAVDASTPETVTVFADNATVIPDASPETTFNEGASKTIQYFEKIRGI